MTEAVVDSAVIGDADLSPRTMPSPMWAFRPMWQWRPRIDAAHDASWPIRVPDQTIDRSTTACSSTWHCRPIDAVGADARAGLDDRALVDEARPLEDGAVLDARRPGHVTPRGRHRQTARLRYRPSMMSRWTCMYFSGVPMSIQ